MKLSAALFVAAPVWMIAAILTKDILVAWSVLLGVAIGTQIAAYICLFNEL